MPDFHVRIAGDEMVFDAAHFITTADGCERLHGHSYRVLAELFGPLDEHQCVVDFLVVREALRAIVGQLSHRVLLPAQHPRIRLSQQGREIEVVCGERRWVFPQDDCLLLPLANTTTELLAQHVAQCLRDRLAGRPGAPPAKIRIEIAESSGASAGCELP
jgi:6-pyruvoyltetrahydropterin/6-carboxytetrahydropterin synthase